VIITAFRELVSRRTATGLAALGLLTATLGFMLLASTSETTQAVLTGDLGSAWAAPYDLLIRPPGTQAALETAQGLVRPNFLAAINGGITDAQLATIRGISGVEVAAPIAVVGDLQAVVSPTINLPQSAVTAPISVFRVDTARTLQGGMSHITTAPEYLVYAPTGALIGRDNPTPLRLGSNTLACQYPTIQCSAGRLCPTSSSPSQACIAGDLRTQAFPIWIDIPIPIVGVDPVAEDALFGFSQCITSGRGLNASDRTTLAAGTGSMVGTPILTMPILAADHTFFDESIQFNVAQSHDSGSVFNSGPAALGSWSFVSSSALTVDGLYGNWIDQEKNSPFWASSLRVPGDVQYRSIGLNHLQAIAVTPNPDVFSDENSFLSSQYLEPPEATDVWLRSLSKHQWVNSLAEPASKPNFVGTFNPDCLATADKLGLGSLGTYASPRLLLPNGQSLAPTLSPVDYANSPPLLLTTMDAAAFFARPDRYTGAPGDKYISSIRVRVAGTKLPGAVAEARLSRVAAQITSSTGLQVDIVKGSSARTIAVDLPKGQFGRGALTVSEGWAQKGVAFRFFQAVSFQNLAIFAAVLVGALILVAQTAYVSVRRRRSELAVLRAIGWPPWRIALLIELEMLILGLAVGAIGLAVGVPLTILARLGPTWWTTVGVVPLAVLIALLAGAVPAVGITRGTTLKVMSEPEPIRERSLPSSALGLGLRQVMAWRWDVALGVAALALGATLLGGIELVAAGFRGQLDTTLLGTYLSGQVRPFHFVVAGLTLAVGALAAAEVVTLAYLERRVQLATLRALGWPRAEVVKMLLGQAIGLGLIAAAIAVAVSIAAGLALSASPVVILGSAATALGMTVIATGIAVIAPLSHAYAADPAAGLRGE
jgi:putative ABC transport system permease protein